MALTKYKLGDLIQQSDARNSDGKYTVDDVRGISTGKEFIETKANMDGVSLISYKVVCKNEFAYVADTSRRGDKIALAYNSGKEILISSIYTVFKVSQPDLLNSSYLFMYFNRPEFDRYSRFNSWGSARETFNWEDMCDIDIELPSLSIQQRYVNVYKAMLTNQQSYERGLDDLKLTCDAYIENLSRISNKKRIGPYLVESDRRNECNLTVKAVRGLATSKEMISTKANMDGVSLSNYKTVLPEQIAYVSDTSRRGDKISLGFNDSHETYLVSSISTVFGTKEELMPQYLMLFLTRSEFDRYARFCSWGSARETFDWDEMCNIEIPIPDINVQHAISDIYTVYVSRKKINDRLRDQIKDICPILIKGSLEEALKEA
ncbi:restriction endonuclease subunit S [Lachnoclostridium sp. Marseille-P6806]|uniref:restriction endonuclease subunit S n=1 Tax=Lachnoclostridium sp. Marseille-P6806 TaxID=2364793 RepID=UPI001031D029|nr:restriction endonuclease subunit S [Lachnoclostridium sp. Marseille-P6806]